MNLKEIIFPLIWSSILFSPMFIILILGFLFLFFLRKKGEPKMTHPIEPI